MIPDRIFLRRCAQKNNLELPRELEDWLLVHFEDEPYENFNTASALKLFLVFLLNSPVFFIVSPAYLEELLAFLVSP